MYFSHKSFAMQCSQPMQIQLHKIMQFIIDMLDTKKDRPPGRSFLIIPKSTLNLLLKVNLWGHIPLFCK